ncbi:MAG: HAMP domain-containing histidine kinase [Sciscionella sp.]|nr:HAMP domain-containing histidine kinase [Sciscionella sp.]
MSTREATDTAAVAVSTRRRAAAVDDVRAMARRLGLQAALGGAVIVLLLAGVSVAVLLRYQHAEADALLSRAVASADDVGDPPAGMWLTIATAAHTATTHGAPAGFPETVALQQVRANGGTAIGNVSLGGVDYRVLTQRRGDEVIQAAQDLSVDQAERTRLLITLLASGLIAGVLVNLGARWLGNRAVAPLSKSLALQRRFVADASHELRTPLTLLSTRAQLLRRRLDGPAVPDELAAEADGVVRDASRLAEVLEDLLAAADPRSEQPAKPVDVVAVARRVTAASAASAAAGGVEVECRAGQPTVCVLASSGGLDRALTSLLDNAIRHASTRVRVEVGVRDGQAVVEVADDGPGIDDRVLPTVFHRASTTSGNGERRYGIGLALVAEFAARHHGHVTAANTATGATLGLTLPLA